MTTETLKLVVDSQDVAKAIKSLSDLADTGKRAEKQTDALTKASEKLASVAKTAAAAFGLYKLSGLVKDATMLAARFETMGVVMEVAGRNAGYSRAQMDEYSKSLQRSGIYMLQSRDALTQLATAHIDLARASELGRAAQNLAVVGDINSSEAMARLIRGIKTGQTETLSTLGLNVRFENGYKTLAAQLGKTTDALTPYEKMLARTNETTDAAAAYNAIYEESMATAGKQMGSLPRYWEDFKVKAGGVFLPVLTQGVFDLGDALKAANAKLSELGSQQTIDAIGGNLAGAFVVVTKAVITMGAWVGETFAAVGRFLGAVGAQAQALADFEFSKIGEIARQVTEDNIEGEAAVRAFTAELWAKNEAIEETIKLTDEQIKAQAAERFLAEEQEAAALAAQTALTEKNKTIAEYIAALEKETALIGKNALETAVYEANLLGVDAVQMAHIVTLTATREARQADLDAANEAAETAAQQKENIDELIKSLQDQQTALGMSEREQAMFNKELEALANKAGPDAVALIRQLTGENYDLEQATRDVKKATEDAARASERAHRDMVRSIERTRDKFGEAFADMVIDGENAFDSLLKSFERMLVEMAGKAIFTGMFGGGNAFNAGGGTATVGTGANILSLLSGSGSFANIGNVLNSVIPGASGNLGIGQNSVYGPTQSGGNLAGGIDYKQIGMNIAAAYAGGYVGNAAGESLFDKQAESNIGQSIGSTVGAAIGGVWGAAIGAFFGSMLDVATGGDGYKRVNAGMLVGPTPGADPSRTFSVNQFDSGLNVTGFARRTDQASATAVIDTFRAVDATITGLVKELEGTIDLSNATLAGLDEEARAGSSGTFVGLGVAGGPDSIADQINTFVDQLADHVTGLDESLLEAIKSATTAEETIRLLADAVAEKAHAEKVLAPILKENTRLQDQLDKLTMSRTELLKKERDALDESSRAIFDSIAAIESLAEVNRTQLSVNSALASVRSAMRAVSSEVNSLASDATNAADEVARAQQRINDLNRQAADEMRELAKTIDEFLAGLSPESYGMTLTGLKAQLTATAELAAGGDKDAQSSLLSQANMVIRSAETSSATRQEFLRQEAFVRSTLLAVRDSIVPEQESEGTQSQLEVAQAELAAAQAVQTLADSAYAAAQALTSNLSLIGTGPLDSLMSALSELGSANLYLLEAQTALIDAQEAAGISAEGVSDAFKLTSEEATALVTVLGLTGAAASDLIASLTDPSGSIDAFISALSGLTPEQVGAFLGSIDESQIDSFLGSISSDQISHFLGTLSLEQITAFLGSISPTEIADFMGRVAPDQISDFLGSVTSDQIADFLGELSLEQVESFLGHLSPEQITSFLGAVSPEQINAFLGSVTPAQVNEFLGTITPDQVAAFLGTIGEDALTAFFADANTNLIDNIAAMFTGASGIISAGVSDILATMNAAATSMAAAANPLNGIAPDGDYTIAEADHVTNLLNTGVVSVGQVADYFGLDSQYIMEELQRQNNLRAMLAGVDGSHASGLDYVPFDGYRAELHKGERVQTASQARASDTASKEMVAELRALKAEMASQRRSSEETAASTYRMKEMLDQVVLGGLSVQTRAA